MRGRTTVALLAALALSAGGCDGAPPRPAPERPRPGGILRASVIALGPLDPSRASWRGALAVEDQIFDSLTRVDPVTRELQPAAATSWTVSRDGLAWTFRLRADATFHDGRPVVAGDFKLAFDRIARKAVGSDAAFQLQHVRGFRDVHDTGAATSLTGVTARTDTVLTIALDRPFAELPYVLSHPRLAPLEVSRYGKTTKGLDDAPVGNGPFRVLRVTTDGATLARYDAYTGPTPLLDGIEFRLARTAEGSWRAFLDGEVDVAEVPPSIAGSGPDRLTGGSTPLWATLSFGPNLARATYAKPQVRRAISLAIDRDAIARTVYSGTKDPATGIVPAGMRGFAPDLCDVCTLDRARAQRLLRAAFGSRLPPIVVDHLSERSSLQVARAVANDLSAVGFETSLRSHSRRDYVTFLQRGKHDFAQLGWLADVPTPDGFLAEQLRTGSPNNQSGFADARFDAFVDAARAEIDDELRLVRYRRAERRALELMPLIPIVFFHNRTAVGPRVRAFELDGAGVFDGTRVWLARA